RTTHASHRRIPHQRRTYYRSNLYSSLSAVSLQAALYTPYMNNQIDSIIFDLDGTLWDAAETVAKAWAAARRQVDFEIQEISADDVRSIAGTQHNLIFQKLFPQLRPEQ